MSGGQEAMLRALAGLKNFTVLLVVNRLSLAVAGRRAFGPICYHMLGTTGDGETVLTSLVDFTERYYQWCTSGCGF
jgi:hypothetical protein